MRIKIGAATALLTALLALTVSQSDRRIDNRGKPRQPAATSTPGWSASGKLAAGLMSEEYGPPQRIFPGAIAWDDCRPWKRIVVEANASTAALEQVVDYYVPDAEFRELARFAHGLVVYADGRELGARSDREELNRMALNLADDIVTGRRTPEQAVRFYARTAELAAAGKSSPYLDRLLFEVPPPPRITPLSAHHF